MLKFVAAVAATVSFAGAAQAISVDGVLDAAYGAPKSSVLYSPVAPNSNFGAPTPLNDSSSYDIYLTSDANSVYGFIQADRVTGLAFSNLYFDIDPANGNGSDIGFEITNDRAFVAGGPAGEYASNLAGLNFAVNAAGTAIEFSLDNSLFTGPIAGLTYFAGQEFASNGSPVTLRLSQSFGYSVAGGPTYGADRLGSVTLGGVAGVPEPATWAMLVGGLGLVGGTLRTRRRAGLATA